MKYWAYLAALQILGRYVWLFARPTLGWFFIALGILGLFLPILQGVLFLFIGTSLVGRRNRLIRWGRVHTKLFIRRWAKHRIRLIAMTGRWALRAQHQFARQERLLHQWLTARMSRKQQAEQSVQ
jgi:hypothetical protein